MKRPSLSELQKRISKDLGVEAFPHSFSSHLATSLAGCFHMLYSHTELELAKLLPDTACGEALKRWGKIWGVTRKEPLPAEGRIAIEAFGPCEIPKGTKFLSGSVEFETTETFEIKESGKKEIFVRATSTGTESNLSASSKITLASPHKNLAGEAAIISVGGGTEREDDESLRQRLLFAIQNPPQGGAVVDYIRWISSVPGVHRAFVRTASKEKPGVIGVSFIEKDGAQSEAVKQNVLTKIGDLLPASVYQVDFVNFNFTPFPLKLSVTPSNLGNKAKDALRQYFRDYFVPNGLYGDRLIRSDGRVFLSKIHEILISLEGKETYGLEKPKEDIIADEGVYFVIP